MSEKLFEKLNNAKASMYLISNPFSKVGSEDFGEELSDELFFKEFHVLDIKTFSRLAKIAEISKDPNQNTVFITGYRGSGKTTFARFLEKKIKNEICLNKISNYLTKEELGDFDNYIQTQDSDEFEQIESSEYIFEENGSRNNVHQSLRDINRILERFIENNISITERLEKFDSILKFDLIGKPIYLNFEVGTGDEKPIEQKLTANLKKQLKKYFYELNNQAIFKNLFNIYNKTKDDFNQTIENKDSKVFYDFFTFIKDKIIDKDYYNEFDRDLDEIFANFSTSQLLTLIVLFDVCNYRDKKIFYIFDNIDIIFETKILNDFIKDYLNFLSNMSSLMPKINKKCKDNISNLYENVKFIFLMRETSSMLISCHINDRMQNFSTHFDISDDLEKPKIVSKKKEFLLTNRKKLSSNYLVETVEKIDKIVQDKYVKDNIFPMFNNDYKRVIQCLSNICEENILEINQYFALIESDSSFNKNGARSILFRLIFNHFSGNQYFNQIGIKSNNPFTPARVLLTYLYNYQRTHNPRFLVEAQDSVSLATIVKDFEYVFSENNDTSKKKIRDSLWGMFSLHKSKTWNHLITFDSIKSIVDKEFKDIFEKPFDENKDINVRITCAGRNYVKFISTHFEFFATRFSGTNFSLFSKKVLKYNQQKKKYEYEILIESVYNAVKKCCDVLKQKSEEIFFARLNMNKNELFNSSYVFHNDNGAAITHEERMIHNHIRYIDNFRLHILDNKANVDTNRKLVNYISNYINLLEENSDYYSDLSKSLVVKLKACIEVIEKSKYTDFSTSISMNN